MNADLVTAAPSLLVDWLRGLPDRRPEPDRLWLRDGRSVTVRAVSPRDAAAEQRFVSGLSLDARYFRFHSGLRQLAPDTLRRMVRNDARQLALVAEPDLGAWDGWEQGDGATPIVADARLVMACDDDTLAEFAVVVADDWQRTGLGRALVERLVDEARARGIRTLHGDVLHDNRAMAALLARVGGRFVAGGGDPRVRRAVIEV